MKKDETLINFLKTIVRRIAGKSAEDIIDILYQKENVNEFKIAEKLKRNINEVRNILYKLSSFNIITSTRKKDKRKGWYTYFWTLDVEKALETLLKFKEQEMKNLEQIVKSRKMKQFYFCEADNIEMSEETALHHNFLCPECNQLLQPANEEKKLKEINLRVEAAQKEYALLKAKLDEIKPKPVIKEEKKKSKAKKKVRKSKKTRPKKAKKRKKAKSKKVKAKKAKVKHKIKKVKKKVKKQKKKLKKTKKKHR
jgi:transcription factor E